MANISRDGFTALSHIGDDQFAVNIVFIHGIRGHARDTWAAKPSMSPESSGGDVPKKGRCSFLSKYVGKSSKTKSATQGDEVPRLSDKVFWPKDFLAEDLPEAKVWTYGYVADVVGFLESNNQNTISEHGQDLFQRIGQLDNVKPILFIVHSLGGIVIKDAIRRSEPLKHRTKLIMFLGTPHRGSSTSTLAGLITSIAKVALMDANEDIIRGLKPNSEILNIIHDEFVNHISKSEMKLHTFYEARGMSGIKRLSGKIVDGSSATIGFSRKLETVQSINANHMQMARFSSREESGYRDILAKLKELGKQQPSASMHPEVQTDPSSTKTAVYYIPLSKNKYFVGRTTELEKLKMKMMMEKPEWQKVSIFGLGGTGKTQVALQFAYEVQESYPEYSIFWIPALGMASFEQACSEIAQLLGIRLTGEKDEDVKELVKQRLSSENAGHWLLIIDNVDDVDLVLGSKNIRGIVDYLPRSEHGLTVYTTRTRQVAQLLSRKDVLEVGAMRKEDAMELLEKFLVSAEEGTLRDDPDAEKLLEELTYLPLAIAQAIAYLNENEVHIREYVELLRNTEQDALALMSEDFHDETRYGKSTNAVVSTWIISFKQIEDRSAAAVELLLFMSCIEWKAIPRSILPRTGTEAELTRAIGTLCSYSFLRRDGETDISCSNLDPTYSMHRLVHLASQKWVEKNGDREEVMEEAIWHMSNAVPWFDWEQRMAWSACAPHALRILERSSKCTTDERAELCVRAGWWLGEEGKPAAAIQWLEESCRLRSQFDPQDRRLLQSRHALAIAYRHDIQIQRALELFENLKVTYAAMEGLPDDDGAWLAAQTDLAGETQKAQELVERVMEARRGTRPAGDLASLLHSESLLGSLYLENGHVQNAASLLEHVVTTYQHTNVRAEDHPDRLVAQYRLAVAYVALCQMKRARALLEYVVNINQKVRQDHHPDRLELERLLAHVYSQDGEMQKALEMMNVVVAAHSTLAENHRGRVLSEFNQAQIYLRSGRIEWAVQIMERLASVTGALAETHPDSLMCQRGLACAYMESHRDKEAIVLFERLESVEERTLVEHHTERLRSQYNLAILYLRNDQLQRALVLLEHLVQASKSLGDHHPHRLDYQSTLAGAYSRNDQTQKALDLFEDILPAINSLAEDDQTRLFTQHDLARAYFADGQRARAIQLMEHVLSVRKRINRPEQSICERLLEEWKGPTAISSNKNFKEMIKAMYRRSIQIPIRQQPTS